MSKQRSCDTPGVWRRSRVRFTVLELLVVVAVIAILAAILLPALRNARITAQRTVCLANVRNVGQTILLYAGENDYTWPTKNPPPGQPFVDAYGMRRSHPYSGASTRGPGGLGLLVSTGVLSSDSLGDVMHCPSFDNQLKNVEKGHKGGPLQELKRKDKKDDDNWVIEWTTGHLARHGSDTPRLDAEILLAHARACERIDLYTRFDDALNDGLPRPTACKV